MAHSVGKVFGGEDTTETFFIVNDKDTIGAFCSTKLTSFRDSNVLRNGKCWTRLESGNSSLCDSLFGSAPAPCSGMMSSRNGALPSEFRFNLLANGLDGRVSNCGKNAGQGASFQKMIQVSDRRTSSRFDCFFLVSETDEMLDTDMWEGCLAG